MSILTFLPLEFRSVPQAHEFASSLGTYFHGKCTHNIPPQYLSSVVHQEMRAFSIFNGLALAGSAIAVIIPPDRTAADTTAAAARLVFTVAPPGTVQDFS